MVPFKQAQKKLFSFKKLVFWVSIRNFFFGLKFLFRGNLFGWVAQVGPV